jgi:hypothetical protein
VIKLPITPSIPYHSIIGDRGRGDTPNSSDGVVPYWSSHLPGAQSELIVNSDHGAQYNPEAIREVERILKKNLTASQQQRMKRILFRFFVLFAISSQVAWSAEAPPLIERPAAESGPTQVSTGIWIVDISSIDSAQQSFTAEIAVVLTAGKIRA